MASFTPGPWHVNGDCWVGFDRNNAEAGGYQFCSVAHVMERTGCAIANARLIAAAPDLLAALKAMMDVQDSTNDCWCGELEKTSPQQCEACMARAAIRKAEAQS